MGRSILSGLVLGAVFSALLLAATSLMVPLPVLSVADTAATAPETALPAPSAPDADTAAATPAMPPVVATVAPAETGPAAAATSTSVVADVAPAAPAASVGSAPATTPDLAPAAVAAEKALVPGIVAVPAGSEFARARGDVAALRPTADIAPVAAGTPAAPVAAPETPPTLAGIDRASRPSAPSGPAAPSAPAAEAAVPGAPQAEQPLPVPPPGEAFAPALPAAIATDLPAVPDVLVAPTGPGPAMPAPVADAAPGLVPDRAAIAAPPPAALPDIILVPDAPATPPAAVVPQPGFAGATTPGFANVPGVAVNRLPSVGGGAGAAPVAAAPVLPEATAPLVAFRAEFVPSGAPMLALVLLDPGAEPGGPDVAALQALGLPMTIALDPMRAGAAEAALGYRAAGFEVAILASRLPAGATPSDLEVALADWRRVLPEAVALVEPPVPVVQGNRGLSQQLIAALAREGLGLATQAGRGLNAAEQLATAADVPQVLIWRVLDAEGDKAPAIRRYLDRAAFEAARGQGVAVMLHAWPESLAALAGWQRGREGGPELAPLSALALAGRAL